MKNVLLVAQREFIATVSTKAFIIGLLVMPMMIGLSAVIFPRLLNPRDFKASGDVAIVDPTGRVMADIKSAFAPERMAERRDEQARQILNQAPAAVQQIAQTRSPQMAAAMATATGASDLRLIERPPTADLQKEKAWLLEQSATRHLALVVIHDNAVTPTGGTTYGSYDAVRAGQRRRSRTD